MDRVPDTDILKTVNLEKSFNSRTVVQRMNVDVSCGEVVGLLGPNGAGKTTTFYMIVGLLKPDKGQIFFNQDEITDLPMFQRARTGIGYLPQENSIFQKLTVEENILAILETLNLSRYERNSRLKGLLAELELTHLRKNKAYSLSGGERRRVEITRALVTSPSFILLDEPFAGIDPIAVDDIQKIVSQLKLRGIGIIITDHNVRETLEITDRAYIIKEGEILEEGTPDEIVTNPVVRKYYLGEKYQ
jgi:lipopolysaccharide export system ATP-binding protein